MFVVSLAGWLILFNDMDDFYLSTGTVDIPNYIYVFYAKEFIDISIYIIQWNRGYL